MDEYKTIKEAYEGEGFCDQDLANHISDLPGYEFRDFTCDVLMIGRRSSDQEIIERFIEKLQQK